MVGDNLPRHSALAAAAFQLQQQTFPKILCAHACRVQRMHYANPLLYVRGGEAAFHRQFLRRGTSGSRSRSDCRSPPLLRCGQTRSTRPGQAGMQMIGKGDGRGKESLKRRLLDVFQRGALEARVQILIEIFTQVDFVKRICCLGFPGHRSGPVSPAIGIGSVWTLACASRLEPLSASLSGKIDGLGSYFQDGLISGVAGALSFQERLKFFRRQFLAAVPPPPPPPASSKTGFWAISAESCP